MSDSTTSSAVTATGADGRSPAARRRGSRTGTSVAAGRTVAEAVADVPGLAAPSAAEVAAQSAAGDVTQQGGRGYSSNKTAHLKRMARIEGQVRGIARMIDEDQYCIDVLTQVSAVTKALQAVSLQLLEEHMAHCVAHAVAAGPQEGDAKLKEAAAAIARLVRS